MILKQPKKVSPEERRKIKRLAEKVAEQALTATDDKDVLGILNLVGEITWIVEKRNFHTEDN